MTTESIEQTHTLEKSLLCMLESQETAFDEYIAYLETLEKEYREYLYLENLKLLSSLSFENLNIQTIPETIKPVQPEFTAGQFNKDDLSKLLGRVNFPIKEPESRKINPMEIDSFYLAQIGETVDKNELKQTMSLSSSASWVRKLEIPIVDDICHLSIEKSGSLWASDSCGNLVHTDLKGKQIQNIQTSNEHGFHSVTNNGHLLFADRDSKVINKIKLDQTIIEYIRTGDWTPLSIHCSEINEDILVGMMKDGEAKVARYNKTREEIQNIQKDNNGQELYSYPYYIAENINGDICISDLYKEALVVVNKSGEHRFTYKGQGSGFRPWGICTDVLGNILVSDYKQIHFLSQNGDLLFKMALNFCFIMNMCCMCLDSDNNLFVGQGDTNTLEVVKFLHPTE